MMLRHIITKLIFSAIWVLSSHFAKRFLSSDLYCSSKCRVLLCTMRPYTFSYSRCGYLLVSKRWVIFAPTSSQTSADSEFHAFRASCAFTSFSMMTLMSNRKTNCKNITQIGPNSMDLLWEHHSEHRKKKAHSYVSTTLIHGGSHLGRKSNLTSIFRAVFKQPLHHEFSMYLHDSFTSTC